MARQPAPAREEESVIDRVLAGDEHAFETLVDRYHQRLLRLARAFVRTDALAADVVQETWIAVFRGLSRFERRSTLLTWMYRILANRARTHAVREARFVPFTDLEADDGLEQETLDAAAFDGHGRWRQPPLSWAVRDPEALAVNGQVRDALTSAIDALPPRQRAAVVLRDVEGVDAADTCDILGISEANQRVLLHRGRTRLRAALAGLLARR